MFRNQTVSEKIYKFQNCVFWIFIFLYLYFSYRRNLYMQNSKRTKNYCFLTIVSFVNFLIIRKFAHFAFMFKSKQNLFLKWNLLKLKKLQKKAIASWMSKVYETMLQRYRNENIIFWVDFFKRFYIYISKYHVRSKSNNIFGINTFKELIVLFWISLTAQ